MNEHEQLNNFLFRIVMFCAMHAVYARCSWYAIVYLIAQTLAGLNAIAPSTTMARSCNVPTFAHQTNIVP